MPRTEIETTGNGPRIGERLKAERIQERLKAERIQERLSELPGGWEATRDGGALTRTFLLPSLGAAGQFVRLVYGIGEAVGFVPRLEADCLEVTLTVATDTEPGVTDLDFDVARLFQLVV